MGHLLQQKQQQKGQIFSGFSLQHISSREVLFPPCLPYMVQWVVIPSEISIEILRTFASFSSNTYDKNILICNQRIFVKSGAQKQECFFRKNLNPICMQYSICSDSKLYLFSFDNFFLASLGKNGRVRCMLLCPNGS